MKRNRPWLCVHRVILSYWRLLPLIRTLSHHCRPMLGFVASFDEGCALEKIFCDVRTFNNVFSPRNALKASVCHQIISRSVSTASHQQKTVLFLPSACFASHDVVNSEAYITHQRQNTLLEKGIDDDDVLLSACINRPIWAGFGHNYTYQTSFSG